MTDDHWREMIRSMHKIEMDMVVIREVFRHQAYIGSSTTVEDYPGKAFYPSKLYPGRMDIAAEDPIEAILSEADKQGMQVLMGGWYVRLVRLYPRVLGMAQTGCQRTVGYVWAS